MLGPNPSQGPTSTVAAPFVTVLLPAVLVGLFPGAPRRLALQAATVGRMIDGLDQHWPGMGDRIRDSRPAVRRHINIYVGGRRASLDTLLHDGAEVTVLTAISGG